MVLGMCYFTPQCIRTRMRARIDASTCTRACKRTRMCTARARVQTLVLSHTFSIIGVRVRICVRVRARMHVLVRAFVSVNVYVYAYVYMCVYVYACAY